MMRILMLDNEFPPLGGGTGVVNYHILEQLATYPDVWVDLVTSSRTRKTYEMEHFSERIRIYKVPVNNRNIHHSTNRELLLYTWRGLHTCCKLIKEQNYDLGFAFAGVPAGGISFALKRFFDLPYIVSLQGPDVPGFEARYNYLYPFLKPVLRHIWGNAAVVTAISGKHQRLANQTMPGLEIPIIYNGVDTRLFYPPDVSFQSLGVQISKVSEKPLRLGKVSVRLRKSPRYFEKIPPDTHREGSKVNILCVGRLIERKGQHYLLQAFARLREKCHDCDLGLILAGTGDFADYLEQMALDLDIANLVTFTGFVSRDEMPEIYRRADIFVLPSQNEGMSIALLEAMASGLPVVVTDTGGTAELVEKGENGYVVPWADVAELTTTLEMLIVDSQTRKRMGAESWKITKEFNWESVTREYLKLCTRIIEGQCFERYEKCNQESESIEWED